MKEPFRLLDKVQLLKDILTCHFYIIIKIEVLCAFTIQGTKWAGLAARINPDVYGANEEIDL